MGLSSSGLPAGTLLVITGSTLRAEEMDRPLAYCVREKIREQLSSAGLDSPVFVMSDFRYLHERHLHGFPAISIGGPGVNAVAHKWLEELPIVLEIDDELYLQMETSVDVQLRASVWGMDHAATQMAVGTFLEHYSEEFLQIPIAKAAKRA